MTQRRAESEQVTHVRDDIERFCAGRLFWMINKGLPLSGKRPFVDIPRNGPKSSTHLRRFLRVEQV